MTKDLHNAVKAVRAISPVSSSDTSALVSQVIDRAGFESLEFVIAIGSIGDADATFAVLVEDSDTNFSGTAVDDAYLLGTEAGAAFQFDDDNEIRKIGYKGVKRYVRLTITPTGNSGTPSAAFIAAIALLGSARKEPQSTQAT